jgi:hypothetical protein
MQGRIYFSSDAYESSSTLRRLKGNYKYFYGLSKERAELLDSIATMKSFVLTLAIDSSDTLWCFL